jgi:hypothetical protein
VGHGLGRQIPERGARVLGLLRAGWWARPKQVRMECSAGASVTKAMMCISAPHSAQRRVCRSLMDFTRAVNAMSTLACIN